MKNITHQVLVTVTPSKAFLAKLNKQSRSNKVFEAIAVIAAGCAILSEIERRKLEEQVYQLSIRVKKLERAGRSKYPMLDFLMISTRSGKRGVIEIYPKFYYQKKQ